MVDWVLRDADLKNYPHLDPPISAADATAYAQDTAAVAAHAFFPFMLYRQRWTRFAKKGEKGKTKERPIRYAARRDAYVYSYYRHQLAEPYEAALADLGLSDSVLAYRRISAGPGAGGKCNIHFARDSIDAVKALGNCAVIALDISSYFESLDHGHLKSLWCRMLGAAKLPPNHFNVFRNITRYCCVDKKELFERLGHFGEKRQTQTGKSIKGYLTPHRDVPRHLCAGREFRARIAGGAGERSILQTNYKRYGIPQGAPISDLLANLYLIDFDLKMKTALDQVGGHYFRYSDDILIIVPGGEDEGRSWMEEARREIAQHGPKLVIKEEKAAVFVFGKTAKGLSFRRVHGTQGADGLEYLGFRFDGRRVYLRNATISSLYRKVSGAARREANALARRYPNKSAAEIAKLFNYERLISQFGRVEDFGERAADYRRWTFWTYAKRAAELFGRDGRFILRQLANHRANIRARAATEIGRAVLARDRRAILAA
jgi:hypothetical protein